MEHFVFAVVEKAGFPGGMPAAFPGQKVLGIGAVQAVEALEELDEFLNTTDNKEN